MLLLKSSSSAATGSHLLSPAARRHFEQAWALLVAAERTDPAAVRDVLDYPTTGAWLAVALAAPRVSRSSGSRPTSVVWPSPPPSARVTRWTGPSWCPRASWCCPASACCTVRPAASG
ncbi:hypothetical protein O1M54_17330 [Streptomyces diastatochromogenes]|nr:hypothetical protein [Streptomyces diastatochromogenes]